MVYGIAVAIILALIGIDHLVKQLIIAFMQEGDSITIIKGFFSITSVRNTGAAWNMFNGQTVFFLIITIIALGVFGYFFTKIDFKTKKLYTSGIILILAGTIGNFIDRMFYPNKAVVDMFEFTFIEFPVFNVADMCLVFGIILFSIDLLFEAKGELVNGKRDNNDSSNTGE